MWLDAKDLIPHDRTMRFIDAVRPNEGDIVARGRVRNDNPLLEPKGLPAHVGIEYMAQAIAGLRGIAEPKSAKRSGVIVNIKEVNIHKPFFIVGEQIEVLVESLYKDETFEVNLCRAIQGDEIISAEISVAEIVNE